MPTYEYECDACHEHHEAFQSMSEAPLKKCPHCGKKKLRRLIGAGAGLIFKGSGFYTTDYRSKEYTDKAKSERSGSSSSGSDSKGSKESGGSGESNSSNSSNSSSSSSAKSKDSK